MTTLLDYDADTRDRLLSSIKLTDQQWAVVKRIVHWLKCEAPQKQIFRVFGFAGVGKTMLARHFAEGVSGRVLFAAYTGKAAHVMRSKGCAGASTVHRLIYKVEDFWSCPEHPEVEQPHDAQCRKCASPLVRRPRYTLSRDSALAGASLLIIDECSMVDDTLGRDLLSFGTPILVLGDPAQLPPIQGCGFFTEAEPDVMLTEIHRQARDNPIIQMSMDIREGRPLRYGDYGSSRIVGSWQEFESDRHKVDQFIVGTNNTRMSINRRECRDSLGGPLPGDKLVCLRNNHQRGFLNGEQFTLLRVDEVSKDGRMVLLVKSDDRTEPDHVETHRHFFKCKDVNEARARVRDAGLDEFAYGYALTCHRAQGSQWGNVVVNDERYRFEEPRRWFYTAVTRAKESVTIITQHG